MCCNLVGWKPPEVADFVVPKVLKAIDYLISRDEDNDGLLEEAHNEDWMDTILRSENSLQSSVLVACIN